MTERSMSRLGGGLGSNQIRWLRSNMKPFDDAWKAVQASDAHARKIRSQLEHGAGLAAERFDTADGVPNLRLVERPRRRRGPVSI